MEILCFYAGIVFVYKQSGYALLLLIIALFYRQRLTLIACFLAAIAWSVAHQYAVTDHGMPNQEMLQNAQLRGKISSIPVVRRNATQFNFTLNRVNHAAVSATIAMACYTHCPELHAGDNWQFIAKLKKPRHLANPGGFDYVDWLNARHIHWTGTVQSNPANHLVSRQSSADLLTVREQLANRLARLDPDEQTLGITQALTLGITQHIDSNSWDLFRRTGTVHLIDISGAHISLIAGLTFTLTTWLWSRFSRLCLLWPAPRVAGFVALIMSAAYTLIAGFAVPAQRALLSCGFMLWRYFCAHRLSIWQAWRYALFIVLLLEPHAISFIGFYLSFLGVAILILVNQRLKTHGVFNILILQLACLFGLMPLSLYWFSYGALNGILANLVAIPWVELWIVPLALLVTFLPSSAIFPWMVWLLKTSILWFMTFLQWVDALSPYNLTLSFSQILSPLALMLGLFVLFVVPRPQFIVPVLLMAVASLWPLRINLPHGQARVDVLDVGQGLAIVVHTQHHVLVYDTGIKFYQGSDMGKLAIIPYLKSFNIRALDAVIISHPDLDHLGGLASLEATYPIGQLIVDDPGWYHRGLACHDFPSWTWDGVRFRFFALQRPTTKKNNHSCILQLSAPGGQVLFTGDIEKPAEDELLTTYAQDLQSTVMIVPHHGSKTSSSAAFVRQVAPRYAILSYGFDNRYHFPHQSTIAVYQQQQIPLFNTVDCGMITVTLKANPESSTLNCSKNGWSMKDHLYHLNFSNKS